MTYGTQARWPMPRLTLVSLVLLLSTAACQQPITLTLPTYIDGNWLNGEFRHCTYLASSVFGSQAGEGALFCGVNKEGEWRQIFSEYENVHILAVAFKNKPADTLRCQKLESSLTCE